MSSTGSGRLRADESAAGRREHVLDAALLTFSRYGYRKASMDDVARDADISRPGLYFYFASKQDLFRAAVTRALDSDVAAAGRALADTNRPLRDRLIEAFDHWTGRYVGPMVKDVAILIESHPDLLAPMVTEYPIRFAQLVTDALAAGWPAGGGAVARDVASDVARDVARDVASDVARTLLATASGIKHEASTREEFLARLTTGVDLLLLALDRSVRHVPS